MKFAGSGAFKPAHQINVNTFTCSSGDNAFYDTRFIGTGKHTAYDGFAFISINCARGVKVEGVRMLDGRGTGIRIADSKNVVLRDIEMEVGSNAITLNDDAEGTDWLTVEGVRAKVGCIGFGAESDDDSFVVSNLFVRNCRFTRVDPIAGDNYGAGLTKSASLGAGLFKKYRNVVFENIFADGFTAAFPVRAVSAGSFRNLVVRNCERGINLAAGNPCEDIDIAGCDIMADDQGVVFAGPSDRVSVRGCRVTLTDGLGINMHGLSRVNVVDNDILFAGSGTATGIRATSSNGQVSNNLVRRASTPFNLSSGGGATLFSANNNSTSY